MKNATYYHLERRDETSHAEVFDVWFTPKP